MSEVTQRARSPRPSTYPLPRVESKVCWRVTRSCNLSCLHCLAGFANEQRPNLPLPSCLAIVRNAEAAEVTRITYTGGEPLVRKDLPLILAAAKHRRIHNDITTHGLLLSLDLCQRLQPLVDRMRVSFDGLRETHNAVRKGNFFDRTLGAIRLCKATGIPVDANVTVLPQNITEIPRLVALLLEHGVQRIILLDLLLRESAAANRIGRVAQTELVHLLFQLGQLGTNSAAITLNLYRDPDDWYVVIESDGEVLLCSECHEDVPCGNAAAGPGPIRQAIDRQVLSHRRHLLRREGVPL